MIYKTAAAFKNALGDRLRALAMREGVSVERLQKRLSFERFLARLFYTGNEPWTLKGGYALELRLSGKARSTKDLDLNVSALGEDTLRGELQEAAERNLNDYFSFTISKGQELVGPPEGGFRFHVEAKLDGRIYNRFPLDVGQGDKPVNAAQWLNAKMDLSFAGLPTPKFLVYPLEDHFAEKLHAYTTPRDNPTRVKDLVDMLLMMETGLETSPLLKTSIEKTFLHYGRHPLPSALPQPPEQWLETFKALADEVALGVNELAQGYLRLEKFLHDLKVFE
jgi:predicted nucleotidyltransferase component of viral defense system